MHSLSLIKNYLNRYWVDPDTARNVDLRIQSGLFIFASANSTVNPLVYGVFNARPVFKKTNTVRGYLNYTILNIKNCFKDKLYFLTMFKLEAAT